MRMTLASLFCGLTFGFGLMISGMTQPTKILDFLDIFGAWDLSLAVVMAAALVVTGLGFALVRRRPAPVFAPRSLWPTRTAIDWPLVIGAVLFGLGWGRPVSGTSAGKSRDLHPARYRLRRHYGPRHGSAGPVAQAPAVTGKDRERHARHWGPITKKDNLVRS
jgi:hypothetical protein